MSSRGRIPVIAICYDFDKTLSPDDMQAQGFIQDVGYDVKQFWDESNALAKNKEMDQNLAWMYEMKRRAEGKIVFTREQLRDHGAKVALFPGVEDWFDRIKDYGATVGVEVEHYIISSGLKEMIEGTCVGDRFKKIFASSFLYDEETDVAVWPAQVVNYTNKTQFLFRIEKGLLDVNDQKVNDHYEPDKIRIPFRNMIYIGDSDTDVPCMTLVNRHGGYSIGVYNAETGDKTKVYKMVRDHRIRYFAPADYSENSELDVLIRQIIERTAKNEILEAEYYSCRNEVRDYDSGIAAEEAAQIDLILALEDSASFAQTHAVVARMKKIARWSHENVDRICEIARSNSQVRYIITDDDIKLFYQSIINTAPENMTESMKVVREWIE